MCDVSYATSAGDGIVAMMTRFLTVTRVLIVYSVKCPLESEETLVTRLGSPN